MDVPSWHPANQDADLTRRLAMASATVPRTEFKVMPGSSADTSTEAGRQFMSELNGGAPPSGVEGRGFYDSSDRLYLMEQKKTAEAQKNKRKVEEDALLQSFRSTALKLQAAQKPVLLVPDVATAVTKPMTAAPAVPAAGGEKKAALLTSAVVTIKPKKRRAPDAAPAVTTKRSKPNKASTQQLQQQQSTADAPASDSISACKPPTTATVTTAAAPPKPAVPAPLANALLLTGYSSSSDDDNDDA